MGGLGSLLRFLEAHPHRPKPWTRTTGSFGDGIVDISLAACQRISTTADVLLVGINTIKLL